MRREIGLRRIEELLEAVDNEIAFLIIVDAIARAHDAQQIESDAMRLRVLEAINRFAFRGDDARAIDADALGCRDKPELDRVPVKPREMFEIMEPQRLEAALAIRLHVICEDWI